MAIYAIGDVQGCYAELLALLEKIHFDPAKDRLWFAGDIVNRGPQSLEVLRFIKSLGTSAFTVLGNHDLHLLAVANYPTLIKSSDTIIPVLQAHDRDDLLNWLRQQPLLHYDEKLKILLVHAGLPPQWDLQLAKQCATEVEKVLRSEDYPLFLEQMYGNQPDYWSDDLKGYDRLRFITNCLTRIRFCDVHGHLNLHPKGTLKLQPEGLTPWFKLETRLSKNLNIAFGHWAALFEDWHNLNEPGIYPLDSGCVWGKKLSALRLEDFQYFQVASNNKICTDGV